MVALLAMLAVAVRTGDHWMDAMNSKKFGEKNSTEDGNRKETVHKLVSTQKKTSPNRQLPPFSMASTVAVRAKCVQDFKSFIRTS